MVEEISGAVKIDVLDLTIRALMEHERKLDQYLERIERIIEWMEKLVNEK